jgi:hypothetical protein
MLGPLCDFLALSVVEAAEETHVMSDATTKKHVSVLGVVVHAVHHLPDGKKIVVDVPLKVRSLLPMLACPS